jgi:DUF3016 family protein
MKHSRLAAAVLSALALAALPAGAAVTIKWSGNPASYLDIGMKTWDREDNMKAIEKIFKEAGARNAPNANIEIEITNVDLAGRDNLTRTGRNIRTMTGNADYPSIDVRYSVDGGAAKAETIEDRNFMDGLVVNTSEPMYYESRMIDRWFKERFGGAK